MRPPYANVNELGFGKYFTDFMYMMRYTAEKGWHDKGVKKYAPFVMDPAACVLHYSQEIFEGLKAYVSADGRVLVFRPEMNARRMNRSAGRLCMPQVPEEDFIRALKEVIMHEKEWIPRAPGTSLYVRPTMIGTEAFLGVKPSKEYIFYIILSPVAAYYRVGFDTIGIYVEEEMVRAVAGGVGDVKTGGNYAASLYAGEKAKEKGFDQVLYLDGREHRYVEEVGSMNVFFVYGNKLVTPALNGSILAGITRHSVIELAGEMGYQVEEDNIAIEQVLCDITNGKITEMFGTGTAAVISPVGILAYKDKVYEINNNKVGAVTTRIYNCLVEIQHGKAEDKHGWAYTLGRI